MKLIVGLGNPGKIYINSRHNIGFLVIKALSKVYKIPLKSELPAFSLTGKGRIGREAVLLAMPLTFMNLSGLAVRALAKKHKIGLENLLIVCDDLDLGLGALRIRPSGSSGGHRGIRSIIEALSMRSEFSRLRLGIGRPNPGVDAASFVLSSFSKKDKEQVEEIIQTAMNCCRVWAEEGIDKAMNIFNGMGKHKALSQPLKLRKEKS